MRIALSNDVELNSGPFYKFGHLNARSLIRDGKFDENSELVKKNGSAIECPVIVYKFRDTALLSGLTGTRE